MSYPLVATKKGVFARMCMLMDNDVFYEGVSPYVKHNFPLLRCHAEDLAKFHYGIMGLKKITLEQIYTALLMTDEISEAEAEKIMHLEEKVSRELWSDDNSVQDDYIGRELLWLNGMEENFSAQLLAGAAKRAVSEKNLTGPARIGAFWGGPILMPYVEWLLRRSKVLNFRRLYFIARDGYILKIMADAIIDALGLEIETHYIHGSRKAWRMPSYLGKEGELRDLVGWSYPPRIKNAGNLADLLGLPVEMLKEYLLPDYRDKRCAFNHISLPACVKALDKSEKFRTLLKDRLTEKRQMVVDYLRQRIDTRDDFFAFVELGGGGFTQVCLSHLMQDFYNGGVRTFFYKLDRVYTHETSCIFYNFFPSKLRNYLLVEMVCRAPEGQTEGYMRQGNKVVPVKKRGEKERYLQHGYGGYVEGIKAFTEAYMVAVSKYKPEPCIKASFACMNALSDFDDKETIDYFASMPNRVTGREEKIPEFAPPLTKQQVQDIFIRYADGINGNHYSGTDFALSLKRSVNFVQEKVKKYQNQAWKIRSRWRRLFPQVMDRYNIEDVGDRNLPYSILGKRVVLYGAGVRGKRWFKILSADKAIEVVQWLDKDYLGLQDEIPVTGDMDSLGQVPFDWVMIDFANQKLLESVIEELQQRGVAKEKIYYPARISEWISGWINYLHV